MKKKLTYAASGVDIDEGERLVSLIKPLARATARKESLSVIGGFGSLFSARFKGLKDPVLVSATDGVGTKLLVAEKLKKHDTIGIDLVAMCVNDLVTTGAEPLFFLDYLATGKLKAEKAREVIKGIARGCKEAGCELSGGETAEMPGLYKGQDYDLAGFSVGVVDKKDIIDGSRIKPGDSIIGLASSGLHSNGYSLARKVLFEHMKLRPSSKPKGLRKSVGAELLTPTRIYVKAVLEAMKVSKILGAAHITGGGMAGNIPRILPKGTVATIQKGSWTVPPIFKLIKEGGNISELEMMRTFNAGIGMALIVRRRDEKLLIDALKKAKVKAVPIGEIRAAKGRKSKPKVEFV